MNAFLPAFSATNPRFFKVIVEETSFIKLKIPPKFMMKYGDYISNSVCLKLPSGCQWEVELTKRDGEAWFEKGWPEFSKFYSLDYGHFLVFTYKGNSLFEVCICDRTLTETEYPITRDVSYGEDDNSIEIFDDSTHSPKTREKCPSPSSRPPKRKRIVSPSNEVEMKERDDEGFSTSSEKATAFSTSSEKATALERAKGFKSENPFIMITMQPHYIHRYTLNIRASFVKSFAKQKRQVVKLHVGDRSWSACLDVSSIYHTAKITIGWPAFAKKNHLRVGDVCIFEVMEVNDLVMKVHIFRR